MANFCINCGTRLGKDDNFCTNCGTKIDKTYINPNNQLSNPAIGSIEKEKAKKELKRVVGGKLLYNKTYSNELLKNGLDLTFAGKAIRQQVEKEIDSGEIKSGGVEFRVNQLIAEYKIKNEKEKTIRAKEKEEKDKKLEMINVAFESEEIKSEIRKNSIDIIYVASIRDSLKNKLIDRRENMSEEEIKRFIKIELEKEIKRQENSRIAKEKEMNSKKTGNGGYCGFDCIHCYEEYLDDDGVIVGDFTPTGIYEYYCTLGHPINFGSFCKYYE